MPAVGVGAVLDELGNVARQFALEIVLEMAFQAFVDFARVGGP